jgi:exosortase/archaeosortase family protein
VPVAVTAACSATDFYLMLVALLAWQLVRRNRPAWFALPAALLVALPLALVVNGARIVAVAAAHRWVIPRLPDAYGPFLHMLTGAAIFLPSLILLNLLLERHGHPRPLRT